MIPKSLCTYNVLLLIFEILYLIVVIFLLSEIADLSFISVNIVYESDIVKFVLLLRFGSVLSSEKKACCLNVEYDLCNVLYHLLFYCFIVVCIFS